MARKFDFDYIIIGSGAAGQAAARTLLKSKKRVALVEGHQFGGANFNTRDVPYSLNLDFSHHYARLDNYPALAGQDLHYNFPTVVSHAERITENLREAAKKQLLDAGLIYIEGYAHFLDSNTIAVHGTQYSASEFILATGSTLKARDIIGLDTVNYLTPATTLKIRRLPKYVLIAGGGSTGCELASYFAELGTRVMIVEKAHRLLPREDKEVSATITEYFQNELGISVITNAKVVAIEQDHVSKRVIFNAAGQEKLVRVDCIVLATGSTPVTDYGLENAGVKYRTAGIVTDKYFATSARNIYAIGDARITTESSTERSTYEGALLAENLLHKTRTAPNYTGFIRLTNTYPAVAAVGFNEYDLLSSDHRYKKSLVHFADLPASTIYHSETGFVKILADANGRLLGATIVAPNAADLAGELSLAIRSRQNVATLAKAPHLENTFAKAIQLAATKLVK